MQVAGERTETIIALFRRTAQVMVSDLIARLHAAGYPDVTGAHHPLFDNIDPDGTRLTVLAARAGMTHQSMSELVQTLEARGFVERRPDPSDRRARLVCLTAEGKRVVARALREIARIEREWRDFWRMAGYDGDMARVLRTGLELHGATGPPGPEQRSPATNRVRGAGRGTPRR